MIEPVTYLRALAGKSKGHIISFSDGLDYVVKFMQPGFAKSLANEWIGYCLARFSELPIPDARIVEVPEEFFYSIPGAEDLRFTPRQFATMHVPSCVNLHQMPRVDSVTNGDTLAGIILLDYWLCNRDRNRNNVLLSEVTSGSYSLWMIDQGDCFGSCNWTLSDLDLGKLSTALYDSTTHRWMAKWVKAEESFSRYLEVMHTIPILLLEEIVASIPNEWCVTVEERKAIVEHLVYRRDKQLEPLMRKFIRKVYRSP
jgi:hypothetical protein